MTKMEIRTGVSLSGTEALLAAVAAGGLLSMWNPLAAVAAAALGFAWLRRDALLDAYIDWRSTPSRLAGSADVAAWMADRGVIAESEVAGRTVLYAVLPSAVKTDIASAIAGREAGHDLQPVPGSHAG